MSSFIQLTKNNASFLLWTLLAITLVILLTQANQPTWYNHLKNDVVIHHRQIKQYYAARGSWHNIEAKDYQPGALWFFLLPSLPNKLNQSFSLYLNITLLINTALIVAHFYLYKRFGTPNSPIIFLIMMLAMGPLLLFRFDLMVTLLVLSAWLLFSHQRSFSAGLLLGISIATKLYPIILIPIMSIALLKNYSFKKLFSFSLSIFIGLAIITTPFLLYGGSLDDILSSFKEHNIKPIGLETLWADGIVITQSITNNRPLNTDGSHYIQGLIPSLLPLPFYNTFWLLSVGTTTLFIVWLLRSKKHAYQSPLIPLCLLTVFIISLKFMAPQYLWWTFSFVPLINFSKYPRSWKKATLATAVVILFFTQLIFPINYYQFIGWFHGTSTNPNIFLLSLERNLLLLFFFFLILLAMHLQINSLSQSTRRSR